MEAGYGFKGFKEVVILSQGCLNGSGHGRATECLESNQK